MSVVPLKQYSGDDWIRIAAQNDALREQKGMSLWTYADAWALYCVFFGVNE